MFFVSGLAPLPFCSVLLFFRSLFEKIFGSELLFWDVGVGLVFFGGFCLCFCCMFWRFAPETVRKILLMSGLVFLGFLLSSGFSSTSFFVCVVFQEIKLR